MTLLAFWAKRGFATLRPLVSRKYLSALVFAYATLLCHAQATSGGRIMVAVEHARQDHVRAISIPLPRMQEMAIPSLDEYLRSHYGLVVAPVARASVLSSDGNDIYSFYKLRLIRAFTHSALGRHEDDEALINHSPGLPRQLLPIASNEIIVRFVGGQMVIDGVQVTYGHKEAVLETSKTYLIFGGHISGSDDTRSNIEFGPANNWSSVFVVGPDADTITPLLSPGSSTVPALVTDEFRGRLSEFAHRVPEVRP
jgi:hypothetical protein